MGEFSILAILIRLMDGGESLFLEDKDPQNQSTDTYKLVEFLSKSPESPVIKYTPDDEDIDASDRCLCSISG